MAKIKSVSLKCGHCGTHQPCAIFCGDTQVFDTLTAAGNIQQCRNPKCRQMIHCNKENMSYVLADGSGGSVGEDFGGNKAR
jgi:hypothetical protein